MLGFVALSIAQICIGFNIVTSKAVTAVVPIHLFLEMRFFTTFLLLFLLTRLSGDNLFHIDEDTTISRNGWLIMFFQSVCGNLLFNIFMMSGLKITSASTAGIISSAMPALLALLAYLILKESLSKQKLIAVSITMLGLLIIGFGTFHQTTHATMNLLGDTLVVLAMIPEALYTILAKFLDQRISFVVSSMWIAFFTSLLFMPMAIFQASHFNWHVFNPTLLGLTLLSATFSAGFFVAWTRGLRDVPANISGLFVGVMPLAAIAAGHTFLGERLNFSEGIGLVLVLLAIVIGVAHFPSRATQST